MHHFGFPVTVKYSHILLVNVTCSSQLWRATIAVGHSAVTIASKLEMPAGLVGPAIQQHRIRGDAHAVYLVHLLFFCLSAR